MQILIVLFLVLGGIGLTVQAAVNARLREAVGSPVLGALISFLVGMIPLALAVAMDVLGRGRLTGLGGQPWWIWVGGLFGAFWVTLAIVGVPRVPLNPWRILGVLLVFAGVLLVQTKK